MLVNAIFKIARGIWRGLWLLGAACLGLAITPAFAQQGWSFFSGPDVAARSVVLMNADTGEILYAREPHLRLPPASTTKVLTAMVVLEHLNPNARLQASYQAASTVPSRIGLRAGETVSTHDLLYGLMLKSGNDAAETLAEGAGGSVYGFSSLMNAKAWEIGARNSHFANPHGLPDDDHYSTAYDLAIIFRQAMKYPLFADIVRTRSALLRIDPGQTPYGDSRFVPVSNHNRLLETYEGALGGKTGFTQKARRCFVGEVGRGGVRLIVSILNSPSSRTLWQDAHALLDYGFARYGLAPQPGQPSFTPQPTIARNTSVMTPDAERLAALSSRTGYTSRFSQDDLEPIRARPPVSAPTANRVVAGYAPAENPSSRRASPVQSSSDEDDKPLVWSRPTTPEDHRQPSQNAARKSEATAAVKPATEPLVWSRRATPDDSQALEGTRPVPSEAVAAVKPANNSLGSTRRASEPGDPNPADPARKVANEQKLASSLSRSPEVATATKPAEEPLVWTRRSTSADVETLSVTLAKPETGLEDDREDAVLKSAASDPAAGATPLIVDRPAVRWVDDDEDRVAARVKKPAAAKSAKPAPSSKAVASVNPAKTAKPVSAQIKAANPVNLAAAPASPKATASSKGKQNAENARLTAKPLASAKAKSKLTVGETKTQEAGKVAKSAKTLAVSAKPDKGASAKVIARAEPTVVKLPQKNVKRGI